VNDCVSQCCVQDLVKPMSAITTPPHEGLPVAAQQLR